MRRGGVVDEAVRLVREEGLSLSEAARRAGTSASAVSKRLRPEATREKVRADNARRGKAKRAWADRHRAACEGCGNPMGEGSLRVGDGSRRWGSLCPECRTARRVAHLREMVRLRVEHDMSNRGIAAQLGVPLKTIATELRRCRAMGLYVPLDPYFKRRAPRSESDADLCDGDRNAILAAFPQLARERAA